MSTVVQELFPSIEKGAANDDEKIALLVQAAPATPFDECIDDIISRCIAQKETD